MQRRVSANPRIRLQSSDDELAVVIRYEPVKKLDHEQIGGAGAKAVPTAQSGRQAMQAAGPLIGVLGGMGPLATAAFMTQMVSLTQAACDQDHCRSLVYSNPRIPDRSQAILSDGPSPLPGLLDGIAMLGRCGADVIAIPCNTAHYWLRELASATDIPIISIVEAVAQELNRRGLTSGRVGVLGTLGLLQSGVYQSGLAALGFDAVVLSQAESARLVEPAIRAIKAGQIGGAEASIQQAIDAMSTQGVIAVVLGCTELPLAVTVSTSTGAIPLVDSTKALATACVAWAARHSSRGRTGDRPTLALA